MKSINKILLFKLKNPKKSSNFCQEYNKKLKSQFRLKFRLKFLSINGQNFNRTSTISFLK